MTLALVQTHVSNQGDGWEYTLGYLHRFMEELRTSGGVGVAAAEAHGGFLALASTLGQRTAQLHVALATRTGDDAFDPEPLLAADVGIFRQRAGTEAKATMVLLRERLHQLPPLLQEQAQLLLARSDELQAYIDAADASNEGGVMCRYHGDYHLGQVLVSGNDFVIIDFEGEPARSFDERRAKSSPLRDVAGMLRSFNYAHWSALRQGAQSVEELERLEPAAREWELATRQAFLQGYSIAAGEAVALDKGLLALFELEKALYELRYELNNRVDWAQVPLQGVLTLLNTRPGA
jgi:maltose alpha-D-glucosyltransferase/alpha-amylase